MLADLVAQIGGDSVSAESLVPLGSDPHIYQPVPSDLRRLSRADLALSQGVGLETWLMETIRSARPARHVVVGDFIDGLPSADELPDPHFWLDPTLWAAASDVVLEKLIELLPEGEHGALRQRHQAYRRRLELVDVWAREQLDTIESSKRILVTSHDAFGYFSRRYELRSEGILGLSTESEASPRDIVRVVEVVNSSGVPAIFIESTIRPNLLQQVARETGVKLEGPLWADSLGPAGSGAETWLGMFTENIRQIVEGLEGSYQPFEVAEQRPAGGVQ